MTINEIIALANAGFSKDEIMALNTQTYTQPQPQPQPQNLGGNFQPQQQNLGGNFKPQPQNWGGGFQPQGQYQNIAQFPNLTGMYIPGQAENAGKHDSNVDVLNALQGLTAAVQNKNVNMTQNHVPKVEKTEDVLASIINPTYEGLGKEE